MYGPIASLESLPPLETERLKLRAFGLEDVDALHAVFSDPGAMRYWSTPPHTDIAQTQKKVEDIISAFGERRVLQWGYERRDEPGVIGSVTLIPAGDQPMAEIGYMLAREHWGSGYAAEAHTAVIDFAFGDLALRRLEADTDPRNEGSVRSLERLGFEREGTLRERWVVDGEVSDSAIFGLLASEWRAGRGSPG